MMNDRPIFAAYARYQLLMNGRILGCRRCARGGEAHLALRVRASPVDFLGRPLLHWSSLSRRIRPRAIQTLRDPVQNPGPAVVCFALPPALLVLTALLWWPGLTFVERDRVGHRLCTSTPARRRKIEDAPVEEVKQRYEGPRSAAETAVERIVDLIVIFALQTVVIPLLLLFALMRSWRWLATASRVTERAV